MSVSARVHAHAHAVLDLKEMRAAVDLYDVRGSLNPAACNHATFRTRVTACYTDRDRSHFVPGLAHSLRPRHVAAQVR